MKISTILITTCLVWAAFDNNLFRRRRDQFGSGPSVSYDAEAEARRELKKRQPSRREVIPPWYESAPLKLKMKVNHFSAKTKDPRYSDQRKIRRRFNNA